MALKDVYVHKIFGGLGQDNSLDSNAAGEQVAVGTTSRVFRGPQAGARISVHIGVTVAGGAGSKATIWYSNLPAPDPTNDAHWVKDTTVGTSGDIALTATGSQMFQLDGKFPEWVRIQVVPAVTPATIYAYSRSEGALAPA